MRCFAALSALLIAAVFCGCASYVTVGDRRYRTLSRGQIDRLVLISRASLKESLRKKMITKPEYDEAMHRDPEVRIDYRGDEFGTAEITWRTGGRRLQFYYMDDLTEEIIKKCAFAISDIPEQERRIVPDKSVPGR